MRAMILAAGLGTRLRPLTLVRPKVLIPVWGTTLLDFWIRQLYRAGCEAVVVNAFHLHESILAAVQNKTWPIPVHCRVEENLLGTAGGIRNVLEFFGREPFVVVNGDIACRLPLRDLYRRHCASGKPVSLVMHDCPDFNNVTVRRETTVVGFGEQVVERQRDAASHVRLLAFTGIHFITSGVLQHLPPGRPAEIIPVYQALIERGQPPQAFFLPELYWREIGSLAAYRALNEELGQLPEAFLPPLSTGQRQCLHPEAEVASSVVLKGVNVVGRGSRIGPEVELENVIVWENVLIEAAASLRNCIVTDGVAVRGVHDGEILSQSQ